MNRNGSRDPQAKRTVLAGGAVALTAALVLTGAPGADAVAPGDGAVTTDSPYVKANARTPSAGDAIRTCGTNRRQQNEPSAAIDPAQPQIIVAGSNDYCTVEGAGGTWAGFYRSTDGGQSWQNSLLPGYPTDDSPEGQASPLQRLDIRNAGDPVQEWDADGRLFHMGNAFNRSKPQNGSVWVATYDQHAAHYVRTVIVGRGTPGSAGRFHDKTSVGVDRGPTSRHKGNVYAAWSLFQGSGNNEIEFTRSTDHGQTFSKQVKISTGVKDNQFADVAVTSDGTVYVTWRQFDNKSGHQDDAVVFVKSTDGGATFSAPTIAVTFDSFDAADTAGAPRAAAQAHDAAYEAADGPAGEASSEASGDSRDCGSGPFACQSGFVFFRHDSQVRVTADPSGDPRTVYAVFDATKPGAVASTSTYNTAPIGSDGTLKVGQGAVYLTKTTDGGASWSTPSLISDVATGHQFFPDINADGGYLHAVWHDTRNDSCYSVQNAIGNCAPKDSSGFHLTSSAGLETYGAVSQNGGGSWSVVPLSSSAQRPDYEMFGDRRVPFHGDYNYVSSVGAFSYNVWTDTRQVVGGDDPRYSGGEGFDVHQCRTLRADGTFSPDTCPNEGGVDQDIFGAATG
ncbi:MAG: glycoside hydrolase [Actinomycetota bacterium]|nr:glycoside hydrolase [Actinomycetota bacterium]